MIIYHIILHSDDVMSGYVRSCYVILYYIMLYYIIVHYTTPRGGRPVEDGARDQRPLRHLRAPGRQAMGLAQKHIIIIIIIIIITIIVVIIISSSSSSSSSGINIIIIIINNDIIIIIIIIMGRSCQRPPSESRHLPRHDQVIHRLPIAAARLTHLLRFPKLEY